MKTVKRFCAFLALVTLLGYDLMRWNLKVLALKIKNSRLFQWFTAAQNKPKIIKGLMRFLINGAALTFLLTQSYVLFPSLLVAGQTAGFSMMLQLASDQYESFLNAGRFTRWLKEKFRIKDSAAQKIYVVERLSRWYVVEVAFTAWLMGLITLVFGGTFSVPAVLLIALGGLIGQGVWDCAISEWAQLRREAALNPVEQEKINRRRDSGFLLGSVVSVSANLLAQGNGFAKVIGSLLFAALFFGGCIVRTFIPKAKRDNERNTLLRPSEPPQVTVFATQPLTDKQKTLIEIGQEVQNEL